MSLNTGAEDLELFSGLRLGGERGLGFRLDRVLGFRVFGSKILGFRALGLSGVLELRV